MPSVVAGGRVATYTDRPTASATVAAPQKDAIKPASLVKQSRSGRSRIRVLPPCSTPLCRSCAGLLGRAGLACACSWVSAPARCRPRSRGAGGESGALQEELIVGQRSRGRAALRWACAMLNRNMGFRIQHVSGAERLDRSIELAPETAECLLR